MFNLNENNQFFLSNSPTDMRVGVNAMCGKVRQAGHEPTNGRVYVFVGKTRTVMKLLHWERGGYVMYYKRIRADNNSENLSSNPYFLWKGGELAPRTITL